MHKQLDIKAKSYFDDLLYNNTVGSRGDGAYAGTNPKSIGNGVSLVGHLQILVMVLLL